MENDPSLGWWMCCRDNLEEGRMVKDMGENFTYERNHTELLETYEWDNLWWEHADETDKERILIIGDSITCGYRGVVNELLQKEIYADGLGTSKSVDNPMMLNLIDYVITQQKNCQIIQFNNGLHGWHLSAQEYKEHYLKIVKYLQEKYPDKKLILVLTTPVREAENPESMAERNQEVIRRNQAVSEIALSENLPVNDLYSVVIDHPEVYSSDGVHLRSKGYAMLAQKCVEMYQSVCNAKEQEV